MKNMGTYISGTRVEVYTTSGYRQEFKSIRLAIKTLFRGNLKYESPIQGMLRGKRKTPIVYNNLNYYVKYAK